MNFLALILGIVLDRLTSLGDHLHRDGWFAHWQSLLLGLGVTGGFATPLAVLLPALLAAFFLEYLATLLFGLPWIAAAGLLLLYSFGRLNVGAMQENYRSQCRREDFQAAWLGVQAEFPDLAAAGTAPEAGQVHDAIQARFLYANYERWFPPLFYFLLLGPAGALGYRLCQLRGDRQWLYLLDWVPVRLLAATFTLTGDFAASADEFLATLRQRMMPAERVLSTVAAAATGEDSAGAVFSGACAATQNEAYAALLRRAAICWVVGISLLVIVS